METVVKTVDAMELWGGDPVLDFVNTLGGLRSTGPLPEDEYVHSYEDLLTFGLRTGTLSEEAALRLRREARLRPEDASATLAAGLELRSLIEHVFRPLAAGEQPADNVLRALRRAQEIALRHATLVRAGDSYEWSWRDDTRELEAPLWPLAHGAVELLTSDSLARLKGCKRCRWIFLDTTKNRSRRWCSMEVCGSEEKKERYVARRRARRS